MNAPEKSGGIWDYAGCGLLCVTPMVTHLAYHDFDFLSVDAAGLLLPLLAVGLLLGLGIRNRSRAFRTLGLTLLTLLFVDLQFQTEDRPPFWMIGLVTLPVIWLLWEHYTRIVSLALLAMIAALPLRTSVSVQRWEARPAKTRADSLIPIVHLLLDEHAAPRAFPTGIPEADRARDRVLDFYRRHRFRLFENAYSRYFWSHSSIPATLSRLDPLRVKSVVTVVDDQHFRLERNDLFSWASSRGYAIRVFQGTYLDTCVPRENLTSCVTYPSNTVSSIRLLRLPAARRILLEYAYFFSGGAKVGEKVRHQASRLMTRGSAGADSGAAFTANRAKAGMDLLALSEIRRLASEGLVGTYLFGHLSLPHFPYEVDRNCDGLLDAHDRLAAGWMEGIWGNTNASRVLRWRLYAGQLECLYSQLDSLLATIDSASPPQGTLILIHGDHGSRIVRRLPRPDSGTGPDTQDLLDGFATILAVRGPRTTFGTETAAVAVQQAVPELIVGNGAGRPYHPDLPAVYLEEYGLRGGPPVKLVAPALVVRQ